MSQSDCKGRRMRLSVDLDAKRNSDVKAMLLRLESENPMVDRTKHVVQAIREYCAKKGCARKRDSV